MAEVTTRIEALRAGAIDVGAIEDLSQVQWFDDHPDISIEQTPTAGVNSFTMDNREPGMYVHPQDADKMIEAGSVFHDINVRKAIQVAYDREFVTGCDALRVWLCRQRPSCWSAGPVLLGGADPDRAGHRQGEGVPGGRRIPGRHRLNIRYEGDWRAPEHGAGLQGERGGGRHQRRGREPSQGHVLDGGVAGDAVQCRWLDWPPSEPGALAAVAEHQRLERVALEQPPVRRVAGPGR